MKFQDRSFKAKAFRPLPHIHIEDDGSLILVATAWGNKAGAEKLIETILEFYYTIQEDSEVTSPFETLDCVPAKANHIRTSIRLANDVLRKEFNDDQYTAGVELFIGLKDNNHFIWTQVGQPHLFISRKNKNIHPMGLQFDLSFDFSNPKKELISLPNTLLGIYNTTQFTIQYFRTRPSDKLILLSSPNIPSELYQISHSDIELNTMSQTLTKSSPELPYWLGVLDL